MSSQYDTGHREREKPTTNKKQERKRDTGLWQRLLQALEGGVIVVNNRHIDIYMTDGWLLEQATVDLTWEFGRNIKKLISHVC